MPMFQYVCPSCGKKFDELVARFSEEVRCPVCGTVAVREWAGAVYSATGKLAPHCSGNCKTCSGCK